MAAIRRLTICIFLTFISTDALSGFFGPSNYDECILKSMKGVTSDIAAAAIVRSCRQQFPDRQKDKHPTRELTDQELSQITGQASLSYGTDVNGKIYNGNGNVTVTQISFIVIVTKGKDKVSRPYIHDVTVPPQNTTDFRFNIISGDKDSDFSWGIKSARGYP